ncbi:MAG: hypothetical protein WBP44_15805 [Gammaproteobacteria bacterium]
MIDISNDDEFRRLVMEMDYSRQRALAARFLEHVLPLSDDERITRIAQIAAKTDASADELATAYHTARTATVELHNRCGAECNWMEQAGYFVARAALAAVSPEVQLADGPAWQTAMSSRMAMTCKSIELAEDAAGQEQQEQYRILSEFLES